MPPARCTCEGGNGYVVFDEGGGGMHLQSFLGSVCLGSLQPVEVLAHCLSFGSESYVLSPAFLCTMPRIPRGCSAVCLFLFHIKGVSPLNFHVLPAAHLKNSKGRILESMILRRIQNMASFTGGIETSSHMHLS
jgi:hypothetical protein